MRQKSPSRFVIDEKYITDITLRTEYNPWHGQENVTADELIKVIKTTGTQFSLSNKDHDEFTKLRNQLEEQGYIKCERGWWNGDRVLKSFYLNEWLFKKGHTFPCASAMQNSIHCARKYGWKTISHL
jgi:hypothetical protein